MKVLLLLASLRGASLGASLGRTPCQSPPQLTGEFSFYMPSLNVTMVGSHVYDAVEQSVRLRMDVRLGDFSFPWDLLLLHKDPRAVGPSGPSGQGLKCRALAGTAAPYTMTVTESGCIPVSYEIHTELFGCFFGRFYNNVRNVVDPDALNPPPYCPGPGVKTQGPPVDFLSLLNRAAK